MRAILSSKLVLLSILVSIPLVGLVGCDSGAKEFNLEILRGALTLSPSVLRVEQHRDVLLNIVTDKNGTIRIPEIEVESTLTTASSTAVQFNAVRIGRFSVTWQEEGAAQAVEIGTLDVFPSR